MLAGVPIFVAILLAIWLTLRFVPRGARPRSARLMLGFALFLVFAIYSFFVLHKAGVAGYFECSSTRCGSSDAHLSVAPIRYWMLYAMYWVLGLLSTFLSMGAVAQSMERKQG